MRRVLIFCVMTLGANAQTGSIVDLSGDWRLSPDDRPEYAASRVDDSAWQTLALPRGPEYFHGFSYWLRRSVTTPDRMDRTQLALTLGTLQDVYEVYVNGTKIGATGNFQSFADAQIPRPRTFDIPAGAAQGDGPLLIAIHIRAVLFFHPFWRLPDTGPYVLTDRNHAPRTAGRQQLETRFVSMAPDLFFSAIFVVIGILSLLGWMSERERKDLLLFAFVSFTRAAASLHLCLALLADGFPFIRTGVAPEFVFGNLHLVLFAEFLFATLGVQSWKLRLALWSGWTLAPIGVLLHSENLIWFIGFPAYVWISGVGLFVIVKEWVSITRRGATPAQHALRLALLLSSANFCLTWLQLLWLNLTAYSQSVTTYGFQRIPAIEFGPYRAQYDHILWLIVSVTILALLLNRLVIDRRERQRLSGELEAARVIQRFLLKPGQLKQVDLCVDAVYMPAHEVGGDFYYVLDGELLVVGDVSGKGLKAAMLVSLITGVLRETSQRTASGVLSSLNDALAGQIEGGFVTCCCARFDTDGTVSVANAGHPAPYCDGREVEVEAGLPLGVVAGVAYEESVVQGEQFTFVSDGVVEAENAQRELFGFDRTREISGKSAQEIAEAAKAWGQNDDITVVAVRRNA